MALKIGTKKLPVKEELEVADTPEEIPEVPDDMPVAEEVVPIEAPAEPIEGGFVDPIAARYFGPEHSCAACIHYMDPGACEVVSGPIDPGGICSIYTADNMPTTEDVTPAPTAPAVPM